MTSKFVLKKTENDKFHFTLVASNGEVVASSQMYATKGGAQNGIDAVRSAAADAVVDDQTTGA